MMQIRSWLIFGAIAGLTIVGCQESLFQENKPIPNKTWEVGNTISFEVEVTDTMMGYDFYIDLRNEATYQYANIFMFVNTTFPSGKVSIDTVECFLADQSGRWLGSGLGDVLDNHILFKQNVRFPNQGTYTFGFQQGMRNEALPSILDLGITIEKHKSK
ncbi:MAG: gliding motility lipoprotein GldH [Flavobacteriales bacterium]|nr:gliding motility lipoprotein GldH [Flavobacteriales bacterium]